MCGDTYNISVVHPEFLLIFLFLASTIETQAKYLNVRHDLKDAGRELYYMKPFLRLFYLLRLLLRIGIIFQIIISTGIAWLIESERQGFGIEIDDHLPAARSCDDFADDILVQIEAVGSELLGIGNSLQIVSQPIVVSEKDALSMKLTLRKASNWEASFPP